MKTFKLKDYIKGWIIGNFEPSIIKTDVFEIGIKTYTSGDYEKSHFHKIATELTIICTGLVKMNNIEYVSGDIILIEPGDITDFACLKDSVTLVVKLPSVTDDKYLI